jgi:hypothetical protein
MKGDSADKKYVNVVGGCAECQAIGEALRILKREGFDEQGRVAVVPGPFMRATHGNLGLSHLPMHPTNAPVRDILAEAFERVQARGADPEFDSEGRDSPQWGNHSIRRAADSAARQSMAETGASEEDIDRVFGWNEAVHASKMQHYYASRRDIVRRAAVTSRL